MPKPSNNNLTLRCIREVDKVSDLKKESLAILKKLEPAAKLEGLKVLFAGIEENTLHLKVHRIGEGIPVAFFIKALEGTFRKYLPQLSGIALVEYQKNGFEAKQSQEFQKVYLHQPPRVKIQPKGLPSTDVSTLNQAQTVQIFETLSHMWQDQSPWFLVTGLNHPPALDGAKKWEFHFPNDYLKIQKEQDQWLVYLTEAPPPDLPIESIPAKLLLK